MKDKIDKTELLKQRALFLGEIARLEGFSDTEEQIFCLQKEINRIDVLLMNYPFENSQKKEKRKLILRGY
jgi:hypothetical protein